MIIILLQSQLAQANNQCVGLFSSAKRVEFVMASESIKELSAPIIDLLNKLVRRITSNKGLNGYVYIFAKPSQTINPSGTIITTLKKPIEQFSDSEIKKVMSFLLEQYPNLNNHLAHFKIFEHNDFINSRPKALSVPISEQGSINKLYLEITFLFNKNTLVFTNPRNLNEVVGFIEMPDKIIEADFYRLNKNSELQQNNVVTTSHEDLTLDGKTLEKIRQKVNHFIYNLQMTGLNRLTALDTLQTHVPSEPGRRIIFIGKTVNDINYIAKEFETNYRGNLDQLQQLYLNVKKEGMMNPDPYTINDLQADLIFAGYTFNFIKQHDMVDKSIDVVLRFLPPVNGQPNEIIGASRVTHNAKRK